MKKILLICTFIATTLTLFGCEENNSQPPVEIQSSTPATPDSTLDTTPVDVPDVSTNTAQSSEYISDVEAKSIALTHANLSESDVTALRVTFEIDDGVPEYEVEFYNGTTEYDYEINAITGDIIGYDYEIEDKFFSIPSTPSAPVTSPTTETTETTTPVTETTQSNGYISEVEAKSIALTHAKLSESDVTALRITFEIDDGVPEYEVEFYSGTTEYDYEINANTGDIVSFDYEIADKFYSSSNSFVTPTTPTTSQSTNGLITEAEAKSIALNHANLLESDITGLRVKLDYDDGVAEYEVEFYSGTNEYDYEINATTGNIISFDYDINGTSPSQTGEYITQDEAKSIALNHANVTESQISNFKIKLDYDDGRAEYEIEWKIGRTEYEYDINASTGAILSFDVDND